MEAAHPGVAPPPAQLRGVRGPSLLGAGELERVRELLVRRLSAVQVAIDARAHADAQESPTKRANPRPHTQPQAQSQPKAADPVEPDKPTAAKRARRPRGATRPAPAGA